MQLAVISPVKYVAVPPWDSLTYHMALAQYVGRWQAYDRFYCERSEEEQVILDNGAAEEGALSRGQLLNRCNVILPEVLVVPDDIHSAAHSIEMARSFLYQDEGLIRDKYNLMMVPHGESLEQWLCCLHIMMGMNPQYIGIAKAHTRLAPEAATMGRAALVLRLRESYPDVRVHLLGVGENPTELYAFDGLNVAGVDTCLPWKLAMQGLLMNRAGVLFRPDTPAWHREIVESNPDGPTITLAALNTEALRSIVAEVRDA